MWLLIRFDSAQGTIVAAGSEAAMVAARRLLVPNGCMDCVVLAGGDK